MTEQTLLDLDRLAPEVCLVVTILVTVIADLFLGARGRTTVGLLGVAGVAVATWLFGVPHLFSGHAAELAGGEVAAEAPRVFGLLVLDGYAEFLRTLIIAGTGLVLLHGLVFRGLEDKTRNEFVPMLLGTALGGCLLVSTDHLIMLLLAMEVLSLNSYLLAGWQRNERRSSEAALKYLVYGALSSAIMTFGFSLYFGLSGSMLMGDVGSAVAAAWGTGDPLSQSVVVVATVLVFVGLGFKVAAFPFHFWAPDVYEGSPTPVTTFLAVGSKAAGFGVLVRFVDGVFLGDISADWLPRLGWMIAVLSAVTMTYGNVVAVLQRNVKRLLAYSSIAHAGYLLMGVAVMTQAAEIPEAAGLGVDALLFYLATYYLGTLGAFGCVMYLANRFGAEDTDDLAGLGWSAPVISTMLLVFLVSLTGLPPTAGFVGKWMLFKATLQTGLSWLAVVAAINAVISLFYYFKVVRALFLRGDHEVQAGLPNRGLVPLAASGTLVLLGAATVWYGLEFDALVAWVERSLL